MTAKPPFSSEPESSSPASGEKPWWSEIMKDITLTGLATIFMTEDSVRTFLKEKNLPKDLASLFLDGISKKKNDVYELVAKEFGKVLSKIDVTQEVGRFLEHHRVHLEAKVSFERKKPAEEKPTHLPEHRGKK
jgi:hypothetical protein